MIGNFCPPALIYAAFSAVHVVFDLSSSLYNAAMVKLVVMVIVAGVLEALCRMKLQVVSWLVLLIPIIALTAITETSLDLFALSPERGGRKEGWWSTYGGGGGSRRTPLTRARMMDSLRWDVKHKDWKGLRERERQYGMWEPPIEPPSRAEPRSSHWMHHRDPRGPRPQLTQGEIKERKRDMERKWRRMLQ